MSKPEPEGKKKLKSNVGKREYNEEWDTVIDRELLQANSRKNWNNFAYCPIFIASLAGNTGTIVYKTQTVRKTINFCILRMAMSDLLGRIIWIPREKQKLYISSG